MIIKYWTFLFPCPMKENEAGGSCRIQLSNTWNIFSVSSYRVAEACEHKESLTSKWEQKAGEDLQWEAYSSWSQKRWTNISVFSIDLEFTTLFILTHHFHSHIFCEMDRVITPVLEENIKLRNFKWQYKCSETFLWWLYGLDGRDVSERLLLRASWPIKTKRDGQLSFERVLENDQLWGTKWSSSMTMRWRKCSRRHFSMY